MAGFFVFVAVHENYYTKRAGVAGLRARDLGDGVKGERF